MTTVGPIAWDLVREKLLTNRKEPSAGSADQRGNLESRLLALEAQVDALRQAEAKQIDDLTKVLRVIGLRAAVALWLGIASMITTLAVLAVVIFK